MKPVAGIAGALIASAASPVWASARGSNDEAVWIALGVVFLGAFMAVAGGLPAFVAKKKDPPTGE